MPQFNPSLHYIKIQTWGTKDDPSNGLNLQIRRELIGGSEGHANIVMTLPINEETKKWVECCFKETFEEYLHKKYLEHLFRSYEEDLLGDFRLHLRFTLEVSEEEVTEIMEEQGLIEKLEKGYKNFSYEPRAEINKFIYKFKEDFQRDKENGGKSTYEEYLKNNYSNLETFLKEHQLTLEDHLRINNLTLEEYSNASGFSFEKYIKESPQIIPLSKKENVGFQIEFSWWPAQDDQPFSLSTTARDMKSEIKGRHFKYNEKWQKYLQPEQRIHRGILGSQVMTYAPNSIAHQRNLSDKQFNALNINIELNLIKSQLEVKESLLDKIDNLKKPEIKDTLKLICQNIKFNTNDFITNYLKENPGKIDITHFKKFFKNKIEEHFNELLKHSDSLKEQLNKLKDHNLEEDIYFTAGTHPDNVVVLPYMENQQTRGLSPEAMLKKMRELTEDGNEFHLVSKNCSSTLTDILVAGAEHDPLLKNHLNERVLGVTATPAQVLHNAEKVIDAIDSNKKNTILYKIKNTDLLSKAVQNVSSSKSSLARLAKLPIYFIMLFRYAINGLLTPTESIKNIFSRISTAAKYTNFFVLAGAVLLSVLPLAVLTPLALIEQVVKEIASPFQALYHWILKKESTSEPLENQITAPLPSTKNDHADNSRENSSHYTLMANLINKEIAGRVHKHIKEVENQQKPLDILNSFEAELKDNPDKIIVLSAKDFDKVHRYVTEKDDPELAKKFQDCCEESLHRANSLSPKTPEAIDKVVQEANMLQTEMTSPNANASPFSKDEELKAENTTRSFGK